MNLYIVKAKVAGHVYTVATYADHREAHSRLTDCQAHAWMDGAEPTINPHDPNYRQARKLGQVAYSIKTLQNVALEKV